MALISALKQRAKGLPEHRKAALKSAAEAAERLAYGVVHRAGLTTYNLKRNESKAVRNLEIGPGLGRIDGFESLDVVPRRNIQYLADAATKLPFRDGTFDLIYASHVLEHLPWYQTEDCLRNWVSKLKVGGRLEIWVPNGLLICQTFVAAEEETRNDIHQDGWYKFNPDRDACAWANGRIFSYGDGRGTRGDPNWHLALFSPRRLRELMTSVGLSDVQEVPRANVRGYDHGWINLGLSGVRK